MRLLLLKYNPRAIATNVPLPLPYPILRYITLRYPPLPSPPLPCPALPCPAIPYPTLPYPALPTLSYPILPSLRYPTLLYPTLPLSNPALPLPALTRCYLPYLDLPCLILQLCGCTEDTRHGCRRYCPRLKSTLLDSDGVNKIRRQLFQDWSRRFKFQVGFLPVLAVSSCSAAFVIQAAVRRTSFCPSFTVQAVV